MDSATPEAPHHPVSRTWLAIPTGLIPGLGPLLRGQLSLGALFIAATLWLRLMLAGHAAPTERVDAFLFGAFGATGGLKNPTFVFMTLVVVAVHALAAYAWLRPQAAQKKAQKKAPKKEAQGS